jgi:hypothetical protein
VGKIHCLFFTLIIIACNAQRLLPINILLLESEMSHWNHRIIHKYHEKTDSHTYQIHEVYYDDVGIIEGWTESAVGPFGETPSELREDIKYFIKAFQKPILKLTVRDGEEILVVDKDVSEANKVN